ITIAFSEAIQINMSGLAIAAIVGITLNAILPGNTYEFGKDLKGDTAVSFEV
ncbi:MAG: uracil-xanthine permease, partial [Ruthenibacterium sp.]